MGSAESWYTSAKAKWTVLDRSDFAYPFAEDTFVRRLIVTDVRDLEAVMEYLPTTGPWEDGELVVGGQTVDGAWQHMSCGYRPLNRGQETGPWEVWQACIHTASTTTDGFETTDDGCTFKNELEFFWRREALELPSGYVSSSGIEYAIESPNRDPATGLWNFIVRKTTQYTTWTGVRTMSDETYFKIEEQTFLGLRDTSTIAAKPGVTIGALWSVGVSVGTGVWVAVSNVSVTKNNNCTVNITQRMITTKVVSPGVQRRSGDYFETTQNDLARNQVTSDSTTPGLTGSGTADAQILSIENKKTDEGAYDVQKDTYTPAAKQVVTITFEGDGKTIVTKSISNYTANEVQTLADALGSVADVSVSFRPNKFGLLDGTIVATISDESSVARTAWSISPFNEYERLASGEVLQLSGSVAFGYNVSSGASTFYGSPTAYRQYSWFHDVGGNWYMYKKITSVTTVYPA